MSASENCLTCPILETCAEAAKTYDLGKDSSVTIFNLPVVCPGTEKLISVRDRRGIRTFHNFGINPPKLISPELAQTIRVRFPATRLDDQA